MLIEFYFKLLSVRGGGHISKTLAHIFAFFSRTGIRTTQVILQQPLSVWNGWRPHVLPQQHSFCIAAQMWLRFLYICSACTQRDNSRTRHNYKCKYTGNRLDQKRTRLYQGTALRKPGSSYKRITYQYQRLQRPK